MNQAKIGKFIAECRKQKNLTQMRLAIGAEQGICVVRSATKSLGRKKL